MPKTVNVVLGEREYEMVQLPVGASKRWREKFAAPIEEMMGAVQYAGEAMNAPANTEVELGVMVSRLGGVLMGSVGRTILGSMELLLNMLCDYCPEMAFDRERIEATAYDDEVMRAFVEVLKLAYPFGEILNLVRGGQGKPETRKS